MIVLVVTGLSIGEVEEVELIAEGGGVLALAGGVVVVVMEGDGAEVVASARDGFEGSVEGVVLAGDGSGTCGSETGGLEVSVKGVVLTGDGLGTSGSEECFEGVVVTGSWSD